MKNIFNFLFFSFSLSISAISQGYAFGIKSGLTVATQKWDASFQREPYLTYHASAFIETYSKEDQFTLFAQAGYHKKGSSIRTFRQVIQTPTGFAEFPGLRTPFEFGNASLILGAKQKYDFKKSSKLYYLIGVRGDYTIHTQLRPDGVDQSNSYFFIYPFDEFVNKFNYGATVGGGIQFNFSELVGGIIELSIHPDFSRQYNQPEIRNVRNPNPLSQNSLTSIPERQIVNTTLELSLGLRFLHKIIYID